MRKFVKNIRMQKLLKELKKTNAVTTVLVVALIGAAFYIGSLTGELRYLRNGYIPTAGDSGVVPDNSGELARGVLRPEDGDHIRGNRDANIAIIEYSDYECPFCGQFHPAMVEAMDQLGDSVMWVYRHFPLDGIHPMARPAAIAAECVSELASEDAFWTFTDTNFENQQLLSLDQIDEWALASGINSAQYETCKTAGDAEAQVEADVQSGSEAGVSGTPGTIVINLDSGEATVLPGAVPASQIVSAVESLQ